MQERDIKGDELVAVMAVVAVVASAKFNVGKRFINPLRRRLLWCCLLSQLQLVRAPVSPAPCVRAEHSNFALYALGNFKFNSYN